VCACSRRGPRPRTPLPGRSRSLFEGSSYGLRRAVMGIRLPRDALELTLERAVRMAEAAEPVPAKWVERVERMNDSPSKTYIAALGTALLAKATDPAVDVLTIKSKAGPRAYSMRGV